MEKKSIKIVIDGKEHNIKTDITLDKYEEYIKNIEDGMEHRLAFEILVDISNIINLDDNTKREILHAVINDNGLQKYYNSINETDDEFKKFYLTANKYFERIYDNLKESIEKLLDFKSNITEPLIKGLEAITRINEEIKLSMQKTLQNIAKVQAAFPSKKEIEQRKKQYIKWAKFGWTTLPFESINFFYSAPSKQIEADRICEAKLSDKEMEKIFNYLKGFIRPKKKINEAIKCYRNECYIATAMQLTALIERELTEFPLKNKKDIKPRGKNIIKSFKEEIDRKLSEYYFGINLFEFLNRLFEYGDDFKKQKYNINRNFLMHGWRDINTTKTDCKKLFLALLNIEFIWEENSSYKRN